MDIQRRLFGDLNEPHHWDSSKSPFVLETWNHLAVSDEIIGSNGNCSDSGGWPLREGLKDIESYHDPLFWHLRNLGRDEIILSINWRFWPQATESNGPNLYCRCPLDAGAIYDACNALELDELTKIHTTMLFKVMAFDTHEDWALYDTWEEAHLLGGTPEFIDAYYRAAGGEEFVRAWFYQWDIMGPITWDWDRPPPKEWQSKFYDFLGWPPAPYLKGRTGSSPDIDWSLTFDDRIKSTGPRK